MNIALSQRLLYLHPDIDLEQQVIVRAHHGIERIEKWGHPATRPTEAELESLDDDPKFVAWLRRGVAKEAALERLQAAAPPKNTAETWGILNDLLVGLGLRE